jgi:hypothetical protein
VEWKEGGEEWRYGELPNKSTHYEQLNASWSPASAPGTLVSQTIKGEDDCLLNEYYYVWWAPIHIAEVGQIAGLLIGKSGTENTTGPIAQNWASLFRPTDTNFLKIKQYNEAWIKLVACNAGME